MSSILPLLPPPPTISLEAYWLFPYITIKRSKVEDVLGMTWSFSISIIHVFLTSCKDTWRWGVPSCAYFVQNNGINFNLLKPPKSFMKDLCGYITLPWHLEIEPSSLNIFLRGKLSFPNMIGWTKQLVTLFTTYFTSTYMLSDPMNVCRNIQALRTIFIWKVKMKGRYKGADNHPHIGKGMGVRYSIVYMLQGKQCKHCKLY